MCIRYLNVCQYAFFFSLSLCLSRIYIYLNIIYIYIYTHTVNIIHADISINTYIWDILSLSCMLHEWDFICHTFYGAGIVSTNGRLFLCGKINISRVKKELPGAATKADCQSTCEPKWLGSPMLLENHGLNLSIENLRLKNGGGNWLVSSPYMECMVCLSRFWGWDTSTKKWEQEHEFDVDECPATWLAHVIMILLHFRSLDVATHTNAWCALYV